MIAEAQGIHQVNEVFQQKSAVFEEAEHAEVADQAYYQQHPLLMYIRLCIQCFTNKVIYYSGQP